MATVKRVTVDGVDPEDQNPEAEGTPEPTKLDTLYANAVAVEGRARTVVVEKVKVHVPKAFTLAAGYGDIIRYEAGRQLMPADHAEHWYSKANGVELINPDDV